MAKNNNTKTAFKAILIAVGVILFATILLWVVSMLNIDGYQWVSELAILIIAVFAVYYILRSGNCEYVYDTIDGNLIFKQRMGKGERYIFALDLENLRKVMDKAATDEEISRRRLKGVPKYYMDKTEGEEYGLLYYDEVDKCEKILKFKPSTQLIEILSEKAIDNASKI